MDLNYCTTTVNRSNYCFILKKRKSAYKENVTVKLKRHSLGNDIDAIRIMNDESKDQKSNESLCLICRTRSECSTERSCSSIETPSRQQPQSSDTSCTNCVATKTSSTIPSTNKWNAFEIANQTSQSLWNASAVSSSRRSGSLSRGRNSSMPSCQLQSTSSSSILPTLSKPLTSSTETSLSSLAPLLRRGCSATEMSSSSLSVSPSSSLSSRTNASASCSNNVSTCIRSNTIISTSTKSSTSFRGSGSRARCAFFSRNVRGTSVSVIRTFAFITVMLEKILTAGVFGTRRQQMPHEYHELDYRVTSKKRSNNKFLPSLPKYPILATLLVFSIVMTSIVPGLAAGAEIQRHEQVCKSRDIRNLASNFRFLENCTVIEGFLLITLINAPAEEYALYTFPKLTEVTEFVVIYHANGLKTLSTLFPNLSIIRGKSLFEGFALVIYENMDLEDAALPSLTTITRGAVRIEKNPALCFVDTVDWTEIAVNMTMDQHFFRENKPKSECPLCPGESDGGTDLSAGCSLSEGQRFCWNSRFCQKICPSTCKNNCNDDLKCCDEACIGGCSKTNISSCTSCRNFANMGVCKTECPKNLFSYLDRRCVTGDECRKIKTKLDGSVEETLIPFDGVCSIRCPAGHNKINGTCVKCVGKCIKHCVGGTIDSVGQAKTLHGCTHITQRELVISIKQGGRHLMEELEAALSSIEVIDTFLKVHRTYGLVSLSFFKNLKRIRGTKLEDNKFALYVLENQDLESIWGPNQTVRIEEGRVFFHFNPKLCYSVINSLRPSLKNGSEFDKNEVATDSNGSKGSCNTTVLHVKIERITSVGASLRILNPMIFEDSRVFIGYQYFYTEDPYRNVSMFGHRPCDDNWSSGDPLKDTTYAFISLKPFTQYAFYVKTQTISTERRNGQSPIMYFRTKSDQPKSVQNLKAVSNSSSEVIVHWLPPTVANGNLTRYVIKARLIDDQVILKSRNYCNDPLTPGEFGNPGFVEKSDPGLISNNGDDCKCEKNVTRKEGANPQLEEAIYENMIDFENNMQNFVYVKNLDIVNTIPKTPSNTTDFSSRRRRQLNLTFTTSTTQAPQKSEEEQEISKMDKDGYYYEQVFDFVNASSTELVLKKLKHFSLYHIAVKACRAREEGASAKECGLESVVFSRTQKLDDVDIVRNLQVDLEPSNTTRSNLRVKWDPPERPNSLIVSYTIFYITANSPDAVHEKRCITQPDYLQNFTNGYLLTGLSTGNYSVRVRANSLAGEGIKSDPVYRYIPANRISWQTITFIIVGVLVLIVAIAWVYYYIRKKFLAPPSDLKMFPTVNPYYISMQYLPDEWEVPRDKIIQLGALGQGSFGMVYEGILKNFNNQEDTPCAIKTVNENATDRERLNFLKEASVMKQFNTHHVVRLLGVCSRGQPALVIMELMKNGDLKAYLRQHRPDAEPLAHGEPPMLPPTLERIYQIAIEIADGMAYLAAKKYVHRDLAARNCMVAADLTVKIGDFGMTRDVYETDYYRKGTKGLLPVRWMSPESLKDGVFSSASDVFSYGVVLWEMATLASQPYQGFSNDQVLRFVIDGGVMERPENCPDKLYKLMQKCWEHRPSARPSFMEIIRFLLNDANPKFQEVSFYHSTEAKDMLDQMHPEHDMDDVTTPLRVGEFDYKLNIDDNSSVEPHESPALDEEDEDDDDDDNVPPHSPYSLGSAIIISSTPGGQSKHSANIVMNQSNLSLSLPSTSAAAMSATIATSAPDNSEYVQPDSSYNEKEEEQQQLHQNNNVNTAYSSTPATAGKAIKKNNHTSSTSKYPSSLKRAVASTVQNVSNSLVPLRIANMNFLHRSLFNKNNSKASVSAGNPRNQQPKSGTKSETSSNNGNNNSLASNVESGSIGALSFFSGLTPSHTSKNPNYQILDESLNVSAVQDEQYSLKNRRLSPNRPSSQRTPRPRTGSCSSAGSGTSNRNAKQLPHQTTEQCNLNRENSSLSTRSKIKDTKSSQSPINPSSAHELSSSSGVSSPISIKDNKNTSDALTVIPTSTNASTSATKTPYQLKENWLRQIPQLPPNGFIGREG